MVTEDYVSLETAKLLNEKGFDCKKESITAMYREDGEFYSLSSSDPYYYDYNDFDEYDYIAPTLQTAMKWLREEHNLHIDPYPEDNDTWCLIIWELYPEHVKDCNGKYDDCSYSTYEEACEAAIKYCLENLI